MPAPIRPVDEHGFPIPTTFDDNPSQGKSVAPTKRKPIKLGAWKWLLLLLLPALLFGGRLVDLGWDFVANMQFQQAQESIAERNFDEALGHANLAIQWEPVEMRRWRAFLLRAMIYERKNMPEQCVADCNSALKYAPKPDLRFAPNPRQIFAREAMEIYRVRAWALQRLGKSRDALDDCTMALESCPVIFRDDLARIRNLRAYIGALSGLELERAAEDVRMAIELSGEIPEFVDTRACVRLKMGHYKLALEDMNMAIRITEGTINPDPIDEHDMQLNLAVMYHHRSQVHEKLGENDKAVRDAQVALDKGYDPSSGE